MKSEVHLSSSERSRRHKASKKRGKPLDQSQIDIRAELSDPIDARRFAEAIITMIDELPAERLVEFSAEGEKKWKKLEAEYPSEFELGMCSSVTDSD